MTEKAKKYLSDILTSIELIYSFLKGIDTFSDYENDLKTQSAIERQLSIIGEAVSKYDQLEPNDTIKNARQIVGFRNRLIHAYDTIDNSIVWVIVMKHLENLKSEISEKIEG